MFCPKIRNYYILLNLTIDLIIKYLHSAEIKKIKFFLK